MTGVRSRSGSIELCAVVDGTAMRVGLSTAVVLIVASCGGDIGSTDEGDQDQETFTASGTVLLVGGGETMRGNGCQGDDTFGFGDLTGGAKVTVLDGDQTKVALGELHAGEMVDVPPGYEQPGLEKACEFSFAIDDVPKGSAVYTIEVGTRGGTDFTENEADSIALVVTSE